MEESAFPDVSTSFRKTSRRPRILVFLVVFLVLLGALIYAGSLYLNQQNEQQAPSPTPIVTPTETPTPSASVSASLSPSPKISVTPKTTGAQLDKGELSIQVLNGSGVAGAANKMSNVLTSAGYDVVETGNADTFDATDVTIRIKKSKSTYLPALKEDLSEDYTVGTTTTTLPETSSYDAVVTVGE